MVVDVGDADILAQSAQPLQEPPEPALVGAQVADGQLLQTCGNGVERIEDGVIIYELEFASRRRPDKSSARDTVYVLDVRQAESLQRRFGWLRPL